MSAAAATFSLFTWPDPDFIRTVIRYWIAQPFEPNFMRLSADERKAVVERLRGKVADRGELNRIQNFETIRAVEQKDSMNLTMGERMKYNEAVKQAITDDESRHRQGESLFVQGLSSVMPDQGNVDDVCRILVDNLQNLLQKALPKQIQEGQCETFSADQFTFFLFETELARDYKDVTLEDSNRFTPHIITHICEMERGVDRFEVRAAENGEALLRFFRLPFMAIPASLIRQLPESSQCRKIYEEHLSVAGATHEAAKNRARFWAGQKILGEQLQQHGKLVSELTDFRFLDELKIFYDKRLWQLLYLSQIVFFLLNSRTEREFFLYREWLFQALVLLSIQVGSRKTVVYDFFMANPNYSAASYKNHRGDPVALAESIMYTSRETSRDPVAVLTATLDSLCLFPFSILEVDEEAVNSDISVQDLARSRMEQQMWVEHQEWPDLTALKTPWMKMERFFGDLIYIYYTTELYNKKIAQYISD